MKHIDLDFLLVLEHMPLATAIYDNSNLRIAYVNEAMYRMWCVGPDIIGRGFADVFPGFEKEGFASILNKVWVSGITYRASDTPAVIVEGNEKHIRYFDFEYKALLDHAGNTYAILHTAIDVTQRKLTAHQLLLQNEHLSFNNDLETLTYTLSHDIKNPLSIAKMGISYLKQQKDDSCTSYLQWYTMISQALTNIENIINQSLKLSAARSIANTPNINDLTAHIPTWCEEVKLLHPTFGGKITTGRLLPIYGDLGAIYQIFSNVIGNAVKYSTTIPYPYVEIYSEQIDRGVVYFIRDNGIGIPEKDWDDIFCSHKRGSNTIEHRGSGIGLCLTRRLIERYGGTIDISSKEGKGTLVRLFFSDPGITTFEK
ncbi:PAS domain-containing sensor histidine kinase [Sphingobacterium yanglingense]|uniref:histidine kinase n=1 Tax=Sphingobacterium yanglingense TaxID=1437280 RepID=A0A4R6WNQ6_9SPHI|nr:PAS domain-containing sensor histidine kinase [Sphingobacterium yanglingense]TDQ80025.1 signal transduction histidine kinase [Sphingobacterium yanglingense]